jgi:hypothetical protein
MASKMTKMFKNLDEGKMYCRQLSVNGKKYKNVEEHECETGYYINGLEFFKAGNFYWLKTYTSWCGMVRVNNVFKINSKGKILKFYLNTFGLSNGKCKVWRNTQDGQQELKDWIEVIDQFVDSEDEERRVLMKDRGDIK